MPTSWHDRSQYGNIVKKLIQTQNKSYGKTKDPKAKLKLSQNVAYLIQIQNSIINDFDKKNEERIDPKAVLELINRNQKLEMELSNTKNRAQYYPEDPKAIAERKRFDKMTNKQKLEYQKNCELEFNEKNQKQTSEVLDW